MVRVSSFRLLPSKRTLLVFLLCLLSWLHWTEAECVPCGCDQFEVVEEEPFGLLVGSLTELTEIQSLCLSSISGCDSYKLVTNEDPFIVNETTGLVTTSQPIDRESKSIVDPDDCIRTQVDVVTQANATNNTTAPSTNRVVFTVHVVDINDNPPKFLLGGINTTQLTAEVQETGPQTDEDLYCSSHLSASDADRGKNAQISYMVVKPDDGSFEVYSKGNQVCLRNLQAIDFEENQSIVIVVQAKDNGDIPLTSNVSVNLTIKDVNDNIPVFQNSSTVTINVSESRLVGSEVATFVAIDADSGDFGRVTYSIGGASLVTLPFTLNMSTGVLYLSKAPDADTMATTMCNFEFDVVAVDGGGLHSDAPLQVCVMLINENDHPPEFFNGPPTSLVYLTEGPQNNVDIIASYVIQDEDSGQGIKQYLDQEEYFRLDLINPDSPNFFVFELYVIVPSIDRETTPSINMSIVFEDSGIPPLSVAVNVTVKINDINDNSPSLTRTNFTLLENIVNGVPIVKLAKYFTDPDYGVNGSFKDAMVISDTMGGLFTVIDKRLVTIGSLDREEVGGNDVVEVMVELFDNGSPVRSAIQTLYITILDENDNVPVFENVDQSTLFVVENEPNLQNITIIKATDDDLGENGTVRYSLTSTNLSLFHIDPVSGQLSATGDFDREMQEHYTITVVATDQGVNSSSTSKDFTITVADTNDWSPEFISKDDSFTIQASTPPKTNIYSVQATDRDSGSNAEIVYSLGGNGSDFFSINASGGIFTAASLEDLAFETVELSVAANNTYQENMSDAITITITVLGDGEGDVLFVYVISGAALLVFLAIIALFVLIGIVYYCRTHTKRKTLNKATSNHIPRRSSLRPTPSAGKDSVTVNSVNGTGAFSRSPTVNFRPDSEVAYYNREQAITKSEFETHTVPVQHNEEKGSDKDIDCPQIPTKESPSQTKHIVPNPRLSDDLSSSSTTSNPPDYSPFYSQHTSQHSTIHQTMVLSEDALKEHNRVYSEGGGMLGDSTARYLATVEEPMDRDDGSTYTDVTGGIHSVIRSYYPSHRSNQSISVPVSQYVSQNGTLPSADSSPNLHYVPTNGSSSIPGVYYSNAREPISSHRRMMVMSDDALHDPLPTTSRYEPTIVTSSSRLLMPESNGMAAVRSIERYPSSSPETQAEEELVHATPLSPTHYPLRYPMPHRTHSRDPLPPIHVHMNGSISHMDLYPPQLNVPRGPPRQRGYQHHHSNMHPHPLPRPSHPMQEKGPPPPPYTSYHSFAASEDNSTMASSFLDQYLVFDHEPAVRQYDLTLSVDDIGLSSTDHENKRPPL